jgi:hypothetical protein
MHGLHCPTCGALARREPAILVCTACGRTGEILDATAEQRHQQRLRDLALRPRSAECHLSPPPPRVFAASVVYPGGRNVS